MIKNEIWSEIFYIHFQIVQLSLNICETNVTEFVQLQIKLINSFLRILGNENSELLSILYVLIEDLSKISQSNPKLHEESARCINRAFNICINDRSMANNTSKLNYFTSSRKMGTFKIASILFKIYFQLNQLNLISNVTKAISATEIPPIYSFPKSHIVAFHYYLGRYYFIKEEFEKSEESLLIAFETIYNRTITNKETFEKIFDKNRLIILKYLIPCRLVFKGIKPSSSLLSTLPIPYCQFYSSLLKYLKNGNLQSYLKLIRPNDQLYDNPEFSFVFEKLIILLFRNYLQKIFLYSSSNTRIPFYFFHSFLPNPSDSVDLASNLISRALMKGYLSEDKQFLVLSAKDPFPSLKSLQSGFLL